MTLGNTSEGDRLMDANEQMATLLGWTYRDEKWWHPSGGSKGWPEYVPDFTAWERFPEMQAYARGLDIDTAAEVISAMMRREPGLGWATEALVLFVTPTILRDALVEVTDEAP